MFKLALYKEFTFSCIFTCFIRWFSRFVLNEHWSQKYLYDNFSSILRLFSTSDSLKKLVYKLPITFYHIRYPGTSLWRLKGRTNIVIMVWKIWFDYLICAIKYSIHNTHQHPDLRSICLSKPFPYEYKFSSQQSVQECPIVMDVSIKIIIIYDINKTKTST